MKVDSVRFLKGILVPVAKQVVVAGQLGEIVVVVSRPAKVARAALRKVGLMEAVNEGTSVFALTCKDATAALGHDPLTRQWTSTPPQRDRSRSS